MTIAPEHLTALHLLAVLGPVRGDVAAGALEDLPEAARVDLSALVQDASIAYIGERVMLTEQGEQALVAAADALFGHARRSEVFRQLFDDFQPCNSSALRLFSSWQEALGRGTFAQRGVGQDPSGELLSLQGELWDVHDRIIKLLGRMQAVVPPLRAHEVRLSRAFERVVKGEHEWLVSHEQSSYHLCWFQMHEDLLRIMDRVRED